MSYIHIKNLSKTHRDKIILDDVTLTINKGEKIALVARNGTGKSTLLKIISGLEDADKGDILMKKSLRVELLEQEPKLDPKLTVIEELYSAKSPMMTAVRKYKESLISPDDIEGMHLAHEAMDRENSWEYESQVDEILVHLGLSKLTGKVGELSGGQQKRIALAKILLDAPDVLLMDEPTNHLDLDMIEWLETYLSTNDVTLILVTHDRYFLDKVCDHIIELKKGKLQKYPGNYSEFLRLKEFNELNENIGIDKLKKNIKREKKWMDRQPQARQTKSDSRVDNYYRMKESVREKNFTKNIEIGLGKRRLGKKILETHNLTKSFGDKKILDKFSYRFDRGERLGIIGKNGTGKTTFLNLLMGELSPDSGKVVRGETVHFGYYTQLQNELDQSQTVIKSIRDVAPKLKLANGDELSAAKMLTQFLFSPNDQYQLVKDLSGGERKRVALLRVLMSNPNFLILDEPTNDFDLDTLVVLEEFLANFNGCLIIISHDRYFMDRIVDHLFVFDGDSVITDFAGNYTQYRNSPEWARKTEPRKSNKSKSAARSQPKKVSAETEKEQKRQASMLYKEISKLENKQKQLNKKLLELGDDYVKMGEISKQIKDIKSSIEEKEELWLSLSG